MMKKDRERMMSKARTKKLRRDSRKNPAEPKDIPEPGIADQVVEMARDAAGHVSEMVKVATAKATEAVGLVPPTAHAAIE